MQGLQGTTEAFRMSRRLRFADSFWVGVRHYSGFLHFHYVKIFSSSILLNFWLSSVLRPEGSGRERMDYDTSCNLIALGRKTEENQIFLSIIIRDLRIFPETFKRSETFRKFPKKRSETFLNFPIYRPSTWLLKLKNACIYDRSRKECTFTLCSYPDFFAHISRGMKYPALPARPGLMRHTFNSL